MAERDPGLRRADIDWAEVRRENGAQARRVQIEMLRNGTHMADAPLPLHKSIYTGEARLAAEIEHLFHDQPIVAGLSGDLPAAGDVLVFDAAGPSILVMRGKDGVVRAFLNMCMHRGAKLIEESEPWSGHAPKISCPFHAWTYDSKGDLVGQPGKAGFANCEIGSRNLVEVPCAEHLGFILVRANPNGAPIDAEEHLGEIAQLMEPLQLQRAVPVKKGIMTADSNWKFALDTYGEGYHFKALHNSTIGQTHYSDKGTYERYGRHHRVSFPDLTMAPLLDLPEDQWPDASYGGVHYIFPNTVLFFGAITPGSYFTQLFRMFPDGVGKMRCQFAVYAPWGVESDEHLAMCQMAYDGTATVVQTEDYRVASHGFANLLTAPADFHVVLGANEPALHGVHRNIAEAIGMPLSQVE